MSLNIRRRNRIVPFDVPENFFPHIVPPIPEGGKVMAMLVGEPGSGEFLFL